jgi:transcriptional regulator with XRE-family HTH domain
MLYRGRVRDAAALGQMLAQARLVRGLSQRDLAQSLGVSQRYIWEMEAGRPTLFAQRLFAHMAATGMTLTAEFADPEPDDG